ncbi:ABC transporter permease [Brucella anthropi]|uniref:ABC transporter permease n=1 Tax=Brucella anthropi TaxID=529 RepID=UPI00124D4C5F|nr:ABC transporter permease [Brucella anthropi]KAB2784171.1 ABC transporter permease [Brucella anthropi]KAB2793119.1 ABC transporter permease [Brucella anthropi]
MSNTDFSANTAPQLKSAAFRSKRLGIILLNYSHVITFLVLVIAASLASPHFLNPINILNVIRGASMVGVVAIGMTVVILCRGIDLSAGSLVGVGAITAAVLAGQGSPIAWIGALAFTTLLGVFNGIIITKLKLQPFIATLSMMIFARGGIYLYSDGGDTIAEGADAAFRWLGSGYVAGIPVPVVLFLMLWLILAYVMKHTRWGRHVYAVGANEEAARVYGIPVDRIKIQVYALSGLLAGIAGLILVSRVSVADPNGGNLFELDAIAAALIGGTSFDGGVGGVTGTILGVLILAIITNLLNLLGVSAFVQMLAKGVIIVAAVVISDQRNRLR